jgi:hypothetical protein
MGKAEGLIWISRKLPLATDCSGVKSRQCDDVE